MNNHAIGYGYVSRAAEAEDRHPAFTIAEFCTAHRISRTHLHNLMRTGRGPRVMKLGRRVLIAAEAAADWRRQLEAESMAEAA